MKIIPTSIKGLFEICPVINGDDRGWFTRIYDSNIFKNRGYFNADIAAKQFENHLSKKSDNSVEIWKWINLELWFREYIDNK